MLIVYTVFKCLDSWYWAADTLISQGLTFDDMFYGYIYGKWLFWAEHLLLIVPMFVLMVKKLRENPVIFYTMMILVCTSITLNRYLLTVQGLAMPVMPFDEWQTYAPNWVEWACCALVFAYSAMVLSLTYRYTPIFPQEAELNKK
jgi:molybdopterin-containing oxidoreductase family membrane subunit